MFRDLESEFGVFWAVDVELMLEDFTESHSALETSLGLVNF